MNLLDLINKTPRELRESVATVAKCRTPLATANPATGAGLREVSQLSQESQGVQSRVPSGWWRLIYPDRDPAEVACFPPATRREVLEIYQGSADAVPITPEALTPSSPLSQVEEEAVRRWLELIGESDPEAVEGVIERCRRDAKARAYFVGRAYEAQG